MSGRTHFVFTAAVLVYSFHRVTADEYPFSPGSDTTTDMFGTEFLYPAPFCNFRSFYKLQMVPRGHDPVAAFVDDPCRFLDPHLNRGFQYGEMRMGDSSTLYIACGHLPQAGHLPNAVVRVVSTREILLHVLAGTDSYSVLPVNALGTRHTVLSMKKHGYASYFVTVTPTQDNTTVTFTLGDGMATTVIINATEQYIYRSEKSLTGTTVTSNQPIFVVSGISDMSDLAEILVEHVIPEHALGKHYVFFVPFDGSTVHVIVYSASEKTIDLHIPDSNTVVMKLNQKYSVRNISSEVAKSSLVTVSSSRPFRLLFFVSTPYQHQRRIKPYRLHAFVSVFPVEQYHGDPCYYGQKEVDVRMAVIAGLAGTGKAGNVYNSLSGIPYQQYGRFLIKAIKGSSTFDAGNKVTNSPNDGLRRLWFHDFTVLRRSRNLYYLDGSANMFTLYSTCTPTPDVKPDNEEDNDCDGLIDEELKNGKDDDGDGKTDEDVTAVADYDCKGRPIIEHTWETNRYRLTRFEPNNKKLAENLPEGNLVMVLVSAFVGITMVFLFMSVIYVMDVCEQRRYGHR